MEWYAGFLVAVSWVFAPWWLWRAATLWVRGDPGGRPGGAGRPRSGRHSGFQWRRAPCPGRLRVTTTLQLPGNWSALRHEGYVVGPCPEGRWRRGGPGRARRRGPAPQGR